MKLTLAVILVTAAYFAYLAQIVNLANALLSSFLLLVVQSLAARFMEGRRV